MSKKRFGTAIPRLQQDYLNLKKDPVPYIRAAEPNPADMLEWHYVIQGTYVCNVNKLRFHEQIDRVCKSFRFRFKVQKILLTLADTIMAF